MLFTLSWLGSCPLFAGLDTYCLRWASDLRHFDFSTWRETLRGLFMIWLEKPSTKLFLLVSVCRSFCRPSQTALCTTQHGELEDRWSMLSIYFYLNAKKTQQFLLMTETHSSLLIYDNFVQWSMLAHIRTHQIISGSKQLQRHSWHTAGLWQWKKIMLITESVYNWIFAHTGVKVWLVTYI